MMPLCTTAMPVGGMRMRVALGRLAVGRPAGVADADGAVQRLLVQPGLEIAELALGAPARQRALLQRGDARRSHSRDIRGA